MTPDTREKDSQQDNPYLLLGFWEFAIIATLMVVFFPWSLLFCVVFLGLTETKYLGRPLRLVSCHRDIFTLFGPR